MNKILETFKKEKQLWIMCIPIVIWVIVFAYVPMAGLIISFYKYIPGKSIFDCQFVGLKYFKDFLTNPVFFKLLRNTLAMSFLHLTIGFIMPIVLALCINELNAGKYRKTLQTISYLPHFISWVVAGSLIFVMLSNVGIVNDMLMKTHIIKEPIGFLTTGKYYWWVYTGISIWKEVGWSAIIYLAAISGVDIELYQAGAVDGIGRWGMVKHVILPTIKPTIILLWILGIGNVLNAGFEQHLILGNVSTQNYWDVIDTYVYRYGVQLGQYSVGTAIGMMKSIIGFGLVLLANNFSKHHLDTSIF
jgi:putative aldouronate transport system permease protein